MDGRNRTSITAGTQVHIVQKQDQGTGKTTQGVVKDILTRSSSHPHGIKVRLTSGEIGRVKQIVSAEPAHTGEEHEGGEP